MRRAREAWLVALVLAGGCAGSALRRDWLPDPGELSHWPYGSAIQITPTQWGAKRMSGELIAISSDSVYVLSDLGFLSVARRDVKRIETRSDWYGHLKTDHTFGRRVPDEGDQKAWEEIRRAARFPGGLPDSLDRATLRLPPRTHGS